MAKLIIGIGVPGAGKTTTLATLAVKNSYEHISIDRVKEELGMNRSELSTDRVWEIMRERMATNLMAGKNVIVDTTFVEQDRRREFFEYARAHGASRIQGVFLSTPPELAWERVQQRGTGLLSPERFSERLKSLTDAPPTSADVFDALFTLDKDANLIEVEMPRESGGEPHKRPFV